MKILQKRTSRFVASLFNGLGIIACVSVSSCGSKGKNSKGNETDKFDGLKKKLKEANDNFGQLDFDDQNKVAEWFKDNPSQTNFSLTKDILGKIFIDNNSKLNDVAQKLGFDISNPDDEANKQVPEWLDKLNEFEDFKDLASDDLKKKVAQKFIEKGIDINDDDAIKNTLSSIISEVQNEEKTKNVTVEIENDGKASIVYSDNHSESFDFKDLDALKNFVNALADKNVVGVGGSWSLVLENDKAKVCEHKDGFDYKSNFDEFLSCLNSLVKIQKLDFKGFQLTVDQEGVSLDDKQLNDDYFKVSDFWNKVKNFPALFGLNSSKLQIEQNGTGDSAIVKINDFATELTWNDVFEGSTIKEEWNKIFDLKEVKGDEEDNKEKIKISYDTTNNKAKVGEQEVQVSALAVQLKGKNKDEVDIADFPQWNSFEDVNKLSSFLDYIKALFDAKVYTEKIKVSLNGKIVSFGSQQLNNNIVTKVAFWESLKSNSSFLNVEKKFLISYIAYDVFIHTSRGEENKKNGVKIQNGFDSFFENKLTSFYPLKDKWNTIFVKD